MTLLAWHWSLAYQHILVVTLVGAIILLGLAVQRFEHLGGSRRAWVCNLSKLSPLGRCWHSLMPEKSYSFRKDSLMTGHYFNVFIHQTTRNGKEPGPARIFCEKSQAFGLAILMSAIRGGWRRPWWDLVTKDPFAGHWQVQTSSTRSSTRYDSRNRGRGTLKALAKKQKNLGLKKKHSDNSILSYPTHLILLCLRHTAVSPTILQSSTGDLVPRMSCNDLRRLVKPRRSLAHLWTLLPGRNKFENNVTLMRVHLAGDWSQKDPKKSRGGEQT